MKALIFENEIEIRDLLSSHLKGLGFETIYPGDNKDVIANVERTLPEILIIDPVFFQPFGLSMLRKLKERIPLNDTLVLVLTRDHRETFKYEALEIGADEVMLKPFRLEDILVRIKALVRRSPKLIRKQSANVTVGEIEIDMQAYRARRNGKIIPLTLTEYKLLVEILKNKNNVVTREHIRDRVLAGTNVTNRTIDVHMASLRKKLADVGDHILTIRGVGYRYSPTGTATANTQGVAITPILQPSL